MRGIPEYIIKLQLGHFYKSDPAYGRGVAELLGMRVEEEELVGAR